MREPLRTAVGDLIASAEASLATLERYRAGLECIARAEAIDPYSLARAVLDGTPVQAAQAADLEALTAPASPEEESDLRRMEARREIVRAALELQAAEDAGRSGGYVALLLPQWHAAERRLYAACRAFRAFREAGGSEVGG